MDVWDELRKTGKPIVLYGTGNGADKLLDRLYDLQIPVAGVFAGDGFVRERSFRGMKVESFETMYARYPDMTVLMCFGSARPEVMDNVKRIAGLCRLLIPEIPVCGDEFFDEAFFRNHKEEIDRVRNLLADDKSHFTLDSLIDYKLSGNPGYLYQCEEAAALSDGLILLPSEPVLMDLGAYTGDTAIRFTNRFKDYSGFIAVEPDRHSFERLKKNTENLKRMRYVHGFVGDTPGMAYMPKGRGRGAHMDENGGIATPVMTVDAIAGNERIDFIKMDVEGHELKALIGAEKTLKTHHPFLDIACYHRSEDLFALPLYLHEICPGYRLYLRHAPSLPAWDTRFLAFYEK